MADVIKEYAIQIQVQGSKAVIKEMKSVDGQINKQNKHLKETNSLLWTYAKRLVSIYAIYKLFKGGINLSMQFAEQGNQLRNLATSANISTKSLQKWSYVVKKYGGSEQSVAQTMDTLNSQLYDYHYFGNKAPFLEYMKRFGDFPVSENAEDFLLELADRIKGEDEQTQKAILDSLNIDKAIQLALRSGNIEEQLKNAKVIFTDEQIDKAVKVKELLIDFNTELRKTMMLFGEKFLPLLTNMLSEVTKFLKDPKKYVVDSINEAGKHFEQNWKDYFKVSAKATGVPFLSGLLSDWMLSKENPNDREKRLEGIGFSSSALKRLEAMNYDISRFGDMREQILRAEFEKNIRNVSVYNDNAININGTKTPEQVAQAVAGNIVGISDHSLTLAGLSFATERKS